MIIPTPTLGGNIAAWDAGAFSARAKVEVYRSGWIDLSSLYGYDWAIGFSIGNEVDAQVMTAEVQLVREQYKLSLSGLMSGSVINAGGDALIRPGRQIKISIAVSGHLATEFADNWLEVFRGYIDSCDFGSNPMRVTCRDIGCVLQDTFIEKTMVYGATTLGACFVWEPGRTVAIGERCIPTGAFTTDPSKAVNKYVYQCTSGGTTGATEPGTWAATLGDTTTDNGVVWQNVDTLQEGIPAQTVIQQILDANGLSSISLRTPSSPSWNIRPYTLDRQSVMEAINAVAQTIGWSCRYYFNQNHATGYGWQLGFYTVNRAKTTADRQLTPAQYLNIGSIAVTRENVRNVVDVVYRDRTVFNSIGEHPKKRYTVTSSASVTKYGRRYCEIQEGDESLIDSPTEAQKMAEAALNDLSEPYADCSVEMPIFPWVELGDLYEITANDVLLDAGTKLSVLAYRHTFQAGQMRTSLTCRSSTPVGAYDKWLAKTATIGASRTNPPAAVGTITGGVSSGAVRLSWDRVKDVRRYCVHIGTTSSFTPTESNYIGDAFGTRFSYSHKDLGSRYFAIVCHSDGLVSVPRYCGPYTL